MIKIEILSSPDSNALGTYTFQANQLRLASKMADINVADPEWKNEVGIIEIKDDELIFYPNKNLSFFKINGKRAVSFKKWKTETTLTIGSTQLKLIQYSFTEVAIKKKILEEKLQHLVKTKSPFLSVIESIHQLMNEN